jgi:hypothetical protein
LYVSISRWTPPHLLPFLHLTWWWEQGWSNLLKGSGNSRFGGNETQIDSASKQYDLKPRNRSTMSPLVIIWHCMVDLSKKAKSFACESKNTIKNKEECN